MRANYPQVNISICAEQDSRSLLDSFPRLVPISLNVLKTRHAIISVLVSTDMQLSVSEATFSGLH